MVRKRFLVRMSFELHINSSEKNSITLEDVNSCFNCDEVLGQICAVSDSQVQFVNPTSEVVEI